MSRLAGPARSVGSSKAGSKILYYPSQADRIDALSTTLQELKVARHSRCLAGHDDEDEGDISTPGPGSTCDCQGLRPPSGSEVRLRPVTAAEANIDDDADEDESSEEVLEGQPWTVCSCGHDLSEHGRIAEEGVDERRRRVKVAIRLDELLEDKDKLLNFDYTDEDIQSLRKQMDLSRPITSTPLTIDPSRKRKLESPDSQLSSPDRPLAESFNPSEAKQRRLNPPTNGSAPKDPNATTHQVSSKTVGGQAGEVADSIAQQQEEAVAAAEAKANPSAKTKAGEGVAAGISNGPLTTKEVAEQPAPPKSAAAAAEEGSAPRRERIAVAEERMQIIRFRIVKNDDDPESMILLTGLKNIFQRQLPKMPREYITRLVLDRNHQSIAIVKNGLQVVGGITYRPFFHRKFAEIVFCAITSMEQVKGYGSYLMDHLKDHVRASSQIKYFLTYADNYAIGYFKKQGFTKEITLDRAIWVGYIKDYEGGTLMQCSMVPRVTYLTLRDLLAKQKEMVLTKIRHISRSHVVHPGVDIFAHRAKAIAEGMDKEEAAEKFKVTGAMVPGLKESGWTPEMDELSRRPKRGPHHNMMRHVLIELGNHPSAWPFAQPVNANDVADYYNVIKQPMDLSTMETKLEANLYATIEDLLVDAQLIFDNCRFYNPASSSYAKSANKLEKFLKDNLPSVSWKQSAGI